MKRSAFVRLGSFLVISLGVAGAFVAGVAYGADSRLDDASANITKAIALLEAAENPGVEPPFGLHRGVAITLLKKAQDQIAKAKAFADKPRKAPPAPPEHHHDHK